MICPRCRCLIADGAFICYPCVVKRQRSEAVQNQLRHAGDVLARKLPLHYRRKVKSGGEVHLALFGYRALAYCGIDLSEYHFGFEEIIGLGGELHERLCPYCAGKLRAVLAECQTVERTA
jgi:hypothetical protein